MSVLVFLFHFHFFFWNSILNCNTIVTFVNSKNKCNKTITCSFRAGHIDTCYWSSCTENVHIRSMRFIYPYFSWLLHLHWRKCTLFPNVCAIFWEILSNYNQHRAHKYANPVNSSWNVLQQQRVIFEYKLCILQTMTKRIKLRVHDDVIKWKHFPRYWPFVREIHRDGWIPRKKASNAKLWCFLWSAPG